MPRLESQKFTMELISVQVKTDLNSELLLDIFFST